MKALLTYASHILDTWTHPKTHTWHILLAHTFGTYFWHLLFSHTCGTYFWHILLAHTFGTYFGTYLCHILVAHTCGTYFWHILLAPTFLTYLWHILLAHTFGTYFWHLLLAHTYGTYFWCLLVAHIVDTQLTNNFDTLAQYVPWVCAIGMCYEKEKHARPDTSILHRTTIFIGNNVLQWNRKYSLMHYFLNQSTRA